MLEAEEGSGGALPDGRRPGCSQDGGDHGRGGGGEQCSGGVHRCHEVRRLLARVGRADAGGGRSHP